MRERRLGRTGLVVSELGFGCFGIGGNASGTSYGPTDDATSRAAVDRALALGCTFFDTADVYGLGHSERLLGEALAHSSAGRRAVVATKGGARVERGRVVHDFTAGHLDRALDASLERLRRDRVDLYQLHDPSADVLARAATYAALERLRDSGRVRHVGVSVHTPEEVGLAVANGIETVQVPCSLLVLLDDSDAWTRGLAGAGEAGVGVIAREPLAAGFLTGRHTEATAYGVGDLRGAWPRGRRAVYRSLADAVAGVAGSATRAQAALRFVMDEPGVDVTLVGMKTPAQVEEDLASAALPPFAELGAGSGRRA